MEKHVLRIRAKDKAVFDLIKRDEKKIETRAAIDSYKKIKRGDKIVFTCGRDKTEKTVARRKLFKSVNGILRVYKIKQINPLVSSKEELEKMYRSFPNYKTKMKKIGLISWELK